MLEKLHACLITPKEEMLNECQVFLQKVEGTVLRSANDLSNMIFWRCKIPCERKRHAERGERIALLPPPLPGDAGSPTASASIARGPIGRNTIAYEARAIKWLWMRYMQPN